MQTLDYITQQMGRNPNGLEEMIIGLLHKAYTDRLNHRFTVDDENILLDGETDEQAGIVELTEDYACAFKTEPVCAGSVKDIAGQVAAASGKLYREISVCGSQPLVTLLSLSVGTPVNANAQSELKDAIASIASYGNTFGIPVVGGDMRLNDSEGIAANLLAIGLIDKDSRLNLSCHGTDNPVYLVGAPDSDRKIPSSAFITRSLYELICDLHDDGAIVAIQSIGRCGIVGACANMVANGTNGIELNAEILDEQKLTEFIPDKVVMILRREYGKKLEKACHKWNMRCMQVGVVIDEHKITVINAQNTIADLPASILSTFFAAIPDKDVQPSLIAEKQSTTEAPLPEEHKDVANFLMTCPNLLSQQWIFEQFDSTVGANNLSTNFISDAAVLRIKGARHALAVSFCQNVADIAKYPESVHLVMAESLQRVICSGGIPCSLTGCLNYYGTINDKTEKYMKDINEHVALFCKKMGITSSGIHMKQAAAAGKSTVGNLSIGAIAFLNDRHQHMTMSFKGKGDMIYMLGKPIDNINSSEYIRNYHNIRNTPPQPVDLEMEAKVLRVAQRVISRKLVKSAHSVSKGGLFIALLESAMVRSFGFDITTVDEIRKDAFLFGELPSRIVVSVAMSREADFIDFMMETEVPFLTLGHVTREEIRIDDNSYGFISDYKKKYY